MESLRSTGAWNSDSSISKLVDFRNTVGWELRSRCMRPKSLIEIEARAKSEEMVGEVSERTSRRLSGWDFFRALNDILRISRARKDWPFCLNFWTRGARLLARESDNMFLGVSSFSSCRASSSCNLTRGM